MKKTVLTFGLISGAVSSALMLMTVPFMDRIGFDHGYLIGYTSMVLAFLLVFFGIKSYRDEVAGGQISFGKAVQIGLLITVISCVCYVITWEIVSHTIMTGFADQYSAYILEKTRASGASDAVIAAKAKELADFKVMYANPLFNVAMTFIEPFPVGLLITLISAAVLRKKRGAAVAEATV